jgi:hypothetical protein
MTSTPSTLTPGRVLDLLRISLNGLNVLKDTQTGRVESKPLPLATALAVVHSRITDWFATLKAVPTILANPAVAEAIVADIEHALDLIHQANLDALDAVRPATERPVPPLELATA